MKHIEIRLEKDGKVKVRQIEYTKIYENEKGYSVYESSLTGRLEVFDKKEDSLCLCQTLEKVVVCDWLKDRYFQYIAFAIYTEKKDSAALKHIKKEMKKYIDKHYGFLFTVDYDAITLESEAQPCKA